MNRPPVQPVVILRSLERANYPRGLYMAAYVELIIDHTMRGVCLRRSVLVATYQGDPYKFLLRKDEYFWGENVKKGREKFRALKKSWSRLKWTDQHGRHFRQWSAHRHLLESAHDCIVWGEVLGVSVEQLHEICVGGK
jgi:hypothetical protein